MTLSAPRGSTDRRQVLNRRVRLLVAATITYNVVEAIVALTAGTIASSTALIGFGLDSVVEVSSAAIVAWQFSARDPEMRERTALRVIAWSFFALAAYVSVESLRSLLGSVEADHSTIGIVLASVSLLVMPFLSYAQRRTGRELGSATAVADSKQTLLCTYLSAVLLVGLLFNSLFGWSWADPIAGLIIAAVARQGRPRGVEGRRLLGTASELNPLPHSSRSASRSWSPRSATRVTGAVWTTSTSRSTPAVANHQPVPLRGRCRLLTPDTYRTTGSGHRPVAHRRPARPRAVRRLVDVL